MTDTINNEKHYPRANILISQFFIQKDKKELATVEALNECANVMIDSGGFSNLNVDLGKIKGPKVEIDDYIDICKRYYDKKVWGYVLLDEILSHEKTLENQAKMLDAGLKPMLVLTPGSPIETINELIAINPRVCVSGMTQTTRIEATIARIQQGYKVAEGDVYIHSLGLSRYPLCVQIPNATMDSSSMNSGMRFGQIMFFDPAYGFKVLHWSEAVKDSKYAMLLLKAGLTSKEIRDKSTYGGTGILSYYPMYSYLKFAQFVQETYNMGFFFAFPGSGHIMMFASIYYSMNGARNGFDVNVALAKTKELRRLIRDDLSRYQYALADCFKRETQWRENTITNERQYESLKQRFMKAEKEEHA